MNDKRIQRMLREVQAYRKSGVLIFAIGLLIIIAVAWLMK